MDKPSDSGTAAVLGLPPALPPLPAFEPFEAGTTPDSICKQIEGAERTLHRFLSLVERVVVSGPGEARRPADPAAQEWLARNVAPLIDAGWSDASDWYKQLYGLTAAVKDIAEHLPEWQHAADYVQRLARLHASIGARLIECAGWAGAPGPTSDAPKQGRA